MTHRNSFDRRRGAFCAALSGLLLLAAGTADGADITHAECKAGHDELIASIEAAREEAVAQIGIQIAEAEDEQRIVALTALRERVWDDEETQRNQAQQIFFDCLKATR